MPKAAPVFAGMMPRFARLLAASAFVLGASACTTHYIPNTDVEDSDDNRKLISFCEKYRHAVELGGRRSGEPGEERYSCIRVAAFRSYAAEFGIIGTGGFQERMPVRWSLGESGGEQGLDLLPTFRRHVLPDPRFSGEL